jgi:subtilase family serine protease
MGTRHRISRRWSAIAAAPVIAAGLIIVPAQAATTRIAVTGGSASWTAHAASLGRAAAGSRVSLQVLLAPRGGEAALEAAVAAASTPGSAAYRHFLTVAAYKAAYEPTSAQVAAVSSWLRSNGFRVTGVEASHRYVSASGTVAQAEQAFGTTLSRYQHAGQSVLAPETAATLPSSIASAVLAVSGLDSTVDTAKPNLTPPPPAFNNARPCSAYYGQLVAKDQADGVTPLPKFGGVHPDYAVCGYTPVQLRAAYEGGSTLTGAGVTVAITDAYGAATILQDANQFAATNGDSAFASGQFTQSLSSKFIDQNLCGSWSGEETLDVEAVHGMAPNANVIYYGAKSCTDGDLLATLNSVADQNKASIVTNSWGDLGEGVSAAEVAAYNQFFNQAALEGISVLFSSGDNGDEVAAIGLKQADFPATSPLVTAVGGTTTAIGPTGSLLWQTGWGTEKYSLSSDGKSWVPVASNPFIYGSGGGYSILYNRPSYQNNVVPQGQSGRAVPDVSLDADPTTGMLIGETQRYPNGKDIFSEYRVGGTSVASPLMAGMTALATQHAGGRLGSLNPAIYGQALHHAGTFTDVLAIPGANVRPDYVDGVDAKAGIVYSVRTFDQDSSLTTGPGWDDVTGIGTPNAAFLNGF